MSRIHSKLNIRTGHRPRTEQNVCFSDQPTRSFELELLKNRITQYKRDSQVTRNASRAEMGVRDKYRRCSHTKTAKCRSRDRGLAGIDVFSRRNKRKPTRSVWPQCSQTNRRVRTGRILSNYEVTVGFSLSANRAMTSELEVETKHTGREMSPVHLGWMICRSRANIVLWLSLFLHTALEECLETNRVAEFPVRSLF